jgi:hypothetical protein
MLLSCTSAFASEPNQFLGAQSCASSSCHGGADTKSNQNLIWSQHDPHSKSFATLVTARSERIAESLNITNAAKNARCTVCHAPFATVPPDLAARVLDPAEGVSCESCHGMAKTWLRSHTRKDFSHAEKVATGMRDLRSPYDRANACVACHQNVDPDILAAGHPELIFELDGQAVSEPKHWQEQTNWSGAQTWLVGQAVAAREIGWNLEKKQNEKEKERWSGVVWVIDRADAPVRSENPTLPKLSERGSKAACDEIAKAIGEIKWNHKLTRDCLISLATASPQFRDSKISQPIQARRAERLVLALDRLLVSTKWKNQKANAALDRLFKLAQSRPDFDPSQFATVLEQFSEAVSPENEPK